MMHKQTLSAEYQTLTPDVRSNLELNWQRDENLYQRQEMIIKIHDLLKQGMSDTSKKWFNQMPRVANYLEQRLYRQASSLKEYNNGRTLADRLDLVKESCMPPNSSWQSNVYLPQRRKMILKIIILLKEKLKRNGIDEDNLDEKKVPKMANHLEHLIYRYAGSFKEYSDSTTLMNRINYVSMMNMIVMRTQNIVHKGDRINAEQEYIKVETDDDDP